jgi:UDP-N-acetylmuramate dehydrogenase
MWPDALKKELRFLCKGTLLFDEPMKYHTSFGIGGPADSYVVPADLDDLQRICTFARHRGLHLLPLGGGTNTLFADAGFRGMIIRMTKNFAKVEFHEDQGIAESGMNLLTFAKRCADRHATGMEFGCGIPGTVGGAVKGNAGAFGIKNDRHVNAVSRRHR